MKPKLTAKIVIDILMTLAMLFLMGYQLWGDVAHEWVGAGMFLLFIVHHVLNFNWHKNLFKNKYTARRIAVLCVDILVFADMLVFIEYLSQTVSYKNTHNHNRNIIKIKQHFRLVVIKKNKLALQKHIRKKISFYKSINAVSRNNKARNKYSGSWYPDAFFYHSRKYFYMHTQMQDHKQNSPIGTDNMEPSRKHNSAAYRQKCENVT